VNEFKRWLQQAVACVTDRIINISPSGYQPSDTPHRLTLGDGAPVWLTTRPSSGPTRLGLSVLQAYRIVRTAERGRWKVQTAAYQYGVDDADGREMFAYHWHPHIEGVAYPHLHIGRGAVMPAFDGVRLSPGRNALQPQLAAAHFPTRRVALEDVLRLLIEQFGVLPRRREWDTALRAARRSFVEDRTWL
jgi:hypothetical protein